MGFRLDAAGYVPALVLSVIWAAVVLPAFGSPANETPHIEFVKEYIRELSELERIRAGSEIELKQKGANPMDNMIHYSTRVQLALRTDIGMLGAVHLGPQFEFLPGQITEFDKQKIEIHDRMIAIATEFLSGPKPGVDYGKIAAEMPKLRAELENIDESFLNLSSLTFATLMDEKPDKDGHMSRLSITSAERQDLLDQLKASFGSKLNQKDQNNLVGAADVLRSYLRKEKGFKCIDEP